MRECKNEKEKCGDGKCERVVSKKELWKLWNIIGGREGEGGRTAAKNRATDQMKQGVGKRPCLFQHFKSGGSLIQLQTKENISKGTLLVPSFPFFHIQDSTSGHAS